MPKAMSLVLKPEQVKELTAARDHHPLPYVRERAAALLKIAQGQSGRQVALRGLFKPRQTDTVYTWVHRYELKGLSGLLIQPGRGRKPAFSPSVQQRRKRPTRSAGGAPAESE